MGKYKDIKKEVEEQGKLIEALTLQLENPVTKEQYEKLQKEAEENKKIIAEAKVKIAETESKILGGVKKTVVSEDDRKLAAAKLAKLLGR